MVQADADRRRPVAAHHAVGDVQAEQDGLRGVGDRAASAHRRWSSRDVPPCRQLGPDRVAEVGDERRRLLVAVRLGQRGEAGDVGEDEGCIRDGQSACIGAGVLISVVVLGVAVTARAYLDDDDRRGHPVNGQAEGRPPPGVRNELAAVLIETLEPVGGQASDALRARPRSCERFSL